MRHRALPLIALAVLLSGCFGPLRTQVNPSWTPRQAAAITWKDVLTKIEASVLRGQEALHSWRVEQCPHDSAQKCERPVVRTVATVGGYFDEALTALDEVYASGLAWDALSAQMEQALAHGVETKRIESRLDLQEAEIREKLSLALAAAILAVTATTRETGRHIPTAQLVSFQSEVDNGS